MSGVVSAEDWGGVLTLYQPYSQTDKLYAVEMVFPNWGPSKQALVDIANFVGAYAASMGLPWNVHGVLIDTDGDKTIVQVVVDWGDGWKWMHLKERFPTFLKALFAKFVETHAAPAGISGAWLELDGPDARYWSPDGGIAPFYVWTASGGLSSKAANALNPKQVLLGSLQHMNEAVPFEAMPTSDGWGTYVAFAIIAAAVILAATRHP